MMNGEDYVIMSMDYGYYFKEWEGNQPVWIESPYNAKKYNDDNEDEMNEDIDKLRAMKRRVTTTCERMGWL